jgi:nucleotide-binding universal stress UspA family protein
VSSVAERLITDMKVLIAYDGTASSEAIFEDLALAGLPGDTEAMILSVGEVWLPPPASAGLFGPITGRSTKANLEKASQNSNAALKRISSLFPTWRLSSAASSGSPAVELIEQADQWKSDLIVLGSHNHTAIGRVLFGSVSQTVVTQASCSVRVARKLVKQGGPPRILVGVDGSAGAAAAVRSIGMRSWPAGTEVRLVSSIGSAAFMDTSVEAMTPTPEEMDKKQKFARLIQLDLETELRNKGLSVSSVIDEGDPRQILLEHSKTWMADSIFVGSRGLGRLKRLLLGSVSTVVVARAHCTVEVVRGIAER